MAGDKQDYDLLIEMRKATRRSHNIANALILSKLVLVLTDKRLYAQALSSFLPVYSKLEALLQQHKDVPGLSTVVAVTSTIPARTAAMEQVCRTAAAASHGVLQAQRASRRAKCCAVVLHPHSSTTADVRCHETTMHGVCSSSSLTKETQLQPAAY